MIYLLQVLSQKLTFVVLGDDRERLDRVSTFCCTYATFGRLHDVSAWKTLDKNEISAWKLSMPPHGANHSHCLLTEGK